MLCCIDVVFAGVLIGLIIHNIYLIIERHVVLTCLIALLYHLIDDIYMVCKNN